MSTVPCRYQFFSSPYTESTLKDLGLKNWSICTCDASSFDCTYDDKETCFLLEGEVTVTS